jgi:hypothetical protein
MKSTGTEYDLLSDPLFYATVAIFAFLSTGLPAVMGQVRFLPLAQTVFLTALTALAVRRRRMNVALAVVAIWVAVQVLTLFAATLVAPGQVEKAFSGGFSARTAQAEWFFSGTPFPGSVHESAGNWLLRTAGTLVGSIVSGGLLGYWMLVRAVNIAAFQAAGFAMVLDSLSASPAVFPPWMLSRIAGLAGLVVLMTEPLLTGNWSLDYYVRYRSRSLAAFAILLVLSFVLEISLLPDTWRNMFLRSG